MLRRLSLILTAGALSTAIAAPKPTPASTEKQAELVELRGQIKQLQKDLSNNESDRSEAADALKNSESSISEANRVLNELASERQLTAAELERLNQDIANTRKNIQASQKRLGDLLKSRYKTGNTEAWHLLLNQQDPNQTMRNLSYYRYIAKSQQDLAQQLERQLTELNQLADQIQEKNEQLQEIARNKQKQKELLVDQQQEKKELVSQLSQKINEQRGQIQKLAADEKRLTQLIDKLNAIIKQQEAARVREAAQRKAAAEKRAADQAKAKAERAARQAKLAQEAKAAGKPAPKPEAEPKPDPKEQTTGVNDDLPDASQAGTAFAALKGRMRLPARGEVIGRFGAPRGEGGTWKGLFIRANSGEPVHAVGTGRVVFADWLRGFGNLMIVDHGGGYMSLYGSNESLLKRVGDNVKAGDTIASTGNSGGMADSGVYFEIRQNSRPQDPAAWAK